MANSNVWDAVLKTLSSNGLWTAVVSSLAIIILGYVIAKTKFLPETFDKHLTKFVMVICLPCLTFTSFMMTITQQEFMNYVFAFGYGFIIYTTMVLLSKVMFLWVKDKTKRLVFEIMFVFGSTNFFGQPIIQALVPEVFGMSNVYNVANLLFVFSYGYYSICISNSGEEVLDENGNPKPKEKLKVGEVFKKVFTNPIVVATMIGFTFWILQLIGDNGWWMVQGQTKKAAFWMINETLVPVYSTLKVIGGLSSPLIWIAIGMVLGKSSFKAAAKDKLAWIYAVLKIIIAPTINFLLLLALRQIPGLGQYVTMSVVFVSTIMWATPTATVIVSYCVNYNKAPRFASSSYLISTVVGVIFIPFLIILLSVVNSIGLFA